MEKDTFDSVFEVFFEEILKAIKPIIEFLKGSFTEPKEPLKESDEYIGKMTEEMKALYTVILSLKKELKKQLSQRKPNNSRINKIFSQFKLFSIILETLLLREFCEDDFYLRIHGYRKGSLVVIDKNEKGGPFHMIKTPKGVRLVRDSELSKGSGELH